MNSPSHYHKKRQDAGNRGVALVLTLLIISMLVVVVVGFVSVSRLEQVAARNFTYQAAAEQMAQLATGQAIERLRQAVQTGVAAGAYATQSGQLHPLGAEESIMLQSDGGQPININSFASYGLVTGATNDSIAVGMTDAPLVAGKITGRTAYYISDETAKLPVNAASPARSALNPVPPRPFSIKGVDVNVQNDVAESFGKILSGNFNNSTISNWSYFFTPEQVALAISNIGPVRSRRTTVAVETNAVLAQKTPWGTDKVRINDVGQFPLTTASIDNLQAAMTNANLAALFGSHFGDKYGANGVRQLAANMLQLRSGYWTTNYLDPNSTNYGKVLEDSVLGLEDLPIGAAPIPAAGSGLLKKTNGIPERLMGYIPFPMLAEIAVGGLEYGFTKGVDPVTGEPPDDNMEIRFFVACKLFNPFPVDYPGGGEILVQIDKARVRMTNANPSTLGPPASGIWRGPDGSHKQLTPGYNDMPNAGGNQPWDPWGLLTGNVNTALAGHEKAEPNPVVPANPPQLDEPLRGLDPPNGVATRPIPPIGAGAMANVFVPFSIVTSARHPTTGLFTGAGADMYIIVDQVRLSAEANQANSVRDWCSGPDMRAAFGDPNTAQFALPVGGVAAQGNFIAGGYAPSAAPANLAPTSWVAITKSSDPRIKTGLQLAEAESPWKTSAATLTNTLPFGPSDFLEARIPADPAYTNNLAMAIYNTNLPPVPALTNGNYSIPADLGKVFTGAPWRTLRMQPQAAEEKDAAGNALIPDWALLELIDFGAGGQAVTKVNPNAGYKTAAGIVAGFGAGLRSSLDVLTNPVAMRTLADPMDVQGAPQPNALPVLSGVGLVQAGISNLISAVSRPDLDDSWAFPGGGWRTNRAKLGFPQSALLLGAEVVELNGFANYNSNPDDFKLNEYRLGALFPAVSTKGRFFKIHAVGQALQGPDDVAATAILQTLLEVNDSTTPPTITTIYQYPPGN